MHRQFAFLLVLLFMFNFVKEITNFESSECRNFDPVSFPKIKVLNPRNDSRIVSNDTYAEIPSSLVSLELQCSASYPVQWGFKKYPYATWDTFSVRKFRKRAPGNTSEEFIAKLNFSTLRENSLEDKFPTCHHVSNKCLSTTIRAKAEEKVKLQFEHLSNISLHPRVEFGRNRNCSIIFAFDKNSEKFYCQSTTGVQPAIFILSCGDPVSCNSIHENSNCSRQPQIDIEDCNDKSNCRNIPLQVNFLPAVAICMIPDSKEYSAAIPYFYSAQQQSLERVKRYFSWSEAPPKDMLVISDRRNKSMYAGEKFDISCNGTYFYFASGLRFQLQIDNMTSELSNAIESVTMQSSTKRGVKTMLPLNRSLIIHDFSLTQPGEYEIICLAPVWNSTDWVTKSTFLTVIESRKPVFYEGNMTETLFYKPRKYIPCEAFGIPLPEISWVLDNHPLPPTITQITGVQNDTESWVNLLFPNSVNGIYGNYTCRAENFAGFEEKTYILLPNDASSSTAMIIVAVLAVLAVVFVSVVIFLSWKVRQQKKELQYLTREEVDEFLNGKPDYIPFECDMNTYAYYLPYNTAFEILRDNLEIHHDVILGSGAYGLVLNGKIHYPSSSEVKAVAVKTTKPIEDSITYFKALLAELKIMTYIGKHDNIVNLEGACTSNIQKREVFIAIELCENGNLLSYLRNHRHVYTNPSFRSDTLLTPTEIETSFTNSDVQYVKMEDLTNIPLNNNSDYENLAGRMTYMDLLRWARQVAEGMEFLSNKKVIHGDLAARNILLTINLTAKIGDFGLSRRLFHYTSYTKTAMTPLPVKWLAIECLRDYQFSVESDVWSYGILLWEIFSLGEIPYAALSRTGEEFLKDLCKGMRLTKPVHATSQIFDVMMSCWRYDRKQRPAFGLLQTFFCQCIDIPSEYVHPMLMQKFSDDSNGHVYTPL